jgi:hypothetical protein
MVLVALFTVLALSGLGGSATAQTYPPTTPPTTPPVQGTTVIPTGVAPTGVAPAQEEAPAGQPAVGAEEGVAPLAFTGAELTLLLAAVGILLGAGAAALIAARRRSSSG